MEGGLMGMRVSDLRALAKERGLRWYASLNKKALVDMIEASKKKPVGNEKWVDYSGLKCSEMREVARKNGLRGWTSLRKAKLEKFLSDNLNNPEERTVEARSDKAKSMLIHGFTVGEVIRILGLEALRFDITRSDMVTETEMGCGILCSNTKLCDFCKDSFPLAS